MTDLSDAAAMPEADPAVIAAAEARANQEAALAEARAKHEAALAELVLHKGRVDSALNHLAARLQASIDKARSDPGHAGYTSAFLTDVEMKGNEIIAWIERHVGAGPA